MPGATDAKIIIDETTRAVAAGVSVVDATAAAISACAPNMPVDRIAQFARLETAYQDRVLNAQTDFIRDVRAVCMDMIAGEKAAEGIE